MSSGIPGDLNCRDLSSEMRTRKRPRRRINERGTVVGAEVGERIDRRCPGRTKLEERSRKCHARLAELLAQRRLSYTTPLAGVAGPQVEPVEDVVAVEDAL